LITAQSLHNKKEGPGGLSSIFLVYCATIFLMLPHLLQVAIFPM